jgi:hypothetical protein
VTGRRPAARPTSREVHVKLTGAYDGWEVTARADFAARLLADLQSGELTRIWSVLDEIVTDHNLPNSKDELAETMADVDPYDGLLEVATGIFDAIGKLPNR